MRQKVPEFGTPFDNQVRVLWLPGAFRRLGVPTEQLVESDAEHEEWLDFVSNVGLE